MTHDEQGQLSAKLGHALGINIARAPRIIPGDGACPVDADRTIVLTKATAAAITLAQPGVVGRRLTIIAGTNAAHVVTSAAANIGDGTTGLNTTLTFAAFIGASVTLVSLTTTSWAVESIVAVTPAP